MSAHAVRYWHGGVPGLKPGDLITPKEHYDFKHERGGCPTCNEENFTRVFVSTDREYCRIYAGAWPRGALYRVDPVGDLEDRATYDNTPAWACESALILAVYDPIVTLTDSQIRRAARRWL